MNIESSSQPLLSICIPTYNRAEYLREALKNITSDPAFDYRIEIVISDNASTDHTSVVGEEFAAKYHNIKYFRNSENVCDANFKLAFSRATGQYLKLSNDTLRYRQGTLSFMIEKIKETNNNQPLFFYNKNIFSKSHSEIIVDDTNQFLKFSSFYIGWIANFGLWKSDIDCLNVPSLYTQLQFTHVAWTFEIIRKHGGASILSGDFYYTSEPSKKASYNLFKVHISNLFHILKDYGLTGIALEREKYRLFRYHVLPLFYRYIYCRKETGFDLTDSYKTIFREYWYRPYLYPGLLVARIRSLLS